MTLLSLLPLIRKNLLTVLSGLALIACVFYYVIDMGKKDLLEDRNRDLSIEHARMLKNLKFAAGLEEDLETYLALEKDSENRLFSIKDLASNYNYFFQLESETGVKLEDLSQSLPRPEPRSKDGRRPSRYQKINYNMKVMGTFDEQIAFLRHLEGGKAFYRLDRIAMGPAKASADNGLLQMNLSLSILGHKES